MRHGRNTSVWLLTVAPGPGARVPETVRYGGAVCTAHGGSQSCAKKLHPGATGRTQQNFLKKFQSFHYENFQIYTRVHHIMNPPHVLANNDHIFHFFILSPSTLKKKKKKLFIIESFKHTQKQELGQ